MINRSKVDMNNIDNITHIFILHVIDRHSSSKLSVSAQSLGAAGVPMAVATNCNPGSSPCCSLLLNMNMACTLMGLTPEEALLPCTLQE